MVDFSKPFAPFELTEPMHIGEQALCFEVVSIEPTGVKLTDPSCSPHPLLITKSDSDWVDWGDDFIMPQPLFDMLFGVAPEEGMIVVMYRPL